jgi:hypothetical protein
MSMKSYQSVYRERVELDALLQGACALVKSLSWTVGEALGAGPLWLCPEAKRESSDLDLLLVATTCPRSSWPGRYIRSTLPSVRRCVSLLHCQNTGGV